MPQLQASAGLSLRFITKDNLNCVIANDVAYKSTAKGVSACVTYKGSLLWYSLSPSLHTHKGESCFYGSGTLGFDGVLRNAYALAYHRRVKTCGVLGRTWLGFAHRTSKYLKNLTERYRRGSLIFFARYHRGAVMFDAIESSVH